MLDIIKLKDGIIQNKTINGMPVNIMIIQPSGKANVRTLIKKEFSEWKGITIHNTGNKNASDTDHAKWMQKVENNDDIYVSPHIYIDYDSITQCIPLNEIGYHAKSNGNQNTLAIEICENKQVDVAENNAQSFLASWIFTYPTHNMYTHQHWTGKFCPRVILSRKNGWEIFTQEIYNLVKKNSINLDNVSAWAKDSWIWSVNMGINDGIGPKDQVTEEKAMVYLHRLYNLLSK